MGSAGIHTRIRRVASGLLAGLALLALGCASAPRLERELPGGSLPWDPVPWAGGAPADVPGELRFVVVGDRTGGHRPGVFAAAIDKINLLRPAFVVSVGDLIEGYSEDPVELDAQWRELEAAVERLEMPFVYVAGNHDLSNAVMARAWRARRGASFHGFRYRDVLFLALNSELFPGVGSDAAFAPDRQAEQLAWARDVLERHADARWTFVFLHRPLWDRRAVHDDWLAIEAWLGERPYSVFAGHRHAYTAHVRRGRHHLTLGTTGGASRLRGLDHGEFDHVTLVSVGSGQPAIANLRLDGIHGVDARSADVRQRVRQLERAIESEPMRVDGPDFTHGTARFVVDHAGDQPLRVSAQLLGSSDLMPLVDSLERELLPGARERFEVPVVARAPAPVGALAPARVLWTLRGSKADGSPLAIEETSWLLPEADLPCPPAAPGLSVDGRLSDWSALPFAIHDRPAAADAPRGASLRFGVAWDDDFVYVGARVIDPSPRFDAGRSATAQDAVQITLDARPAPARDANAGIHRARHEGWLPELVFAWLLPGETRSDAALDAFLPALPPGTRRAARTTAAGYDVELAIPARFLDERQGGPWQGFRLNLALQDFDAAGSVTHWWRPDRFGASDATPVRGAGTFRRSHR